MNSFFTAGNIIVQFIFGLIAWLVLLRLFIEWFRADFYNPLCQGIYKLFNPITAPLRKIISSINGFNIGVFLLLVLVVVIEVIVINALNGMQATVSGMSKFGLALLLDHILTFIFWLIVIRAILSFVSANPNNAMVPIIIRITNPMLRPFSRLLPPMGGIDFSPMLLLLAIYLLRALVVTPLLSGT